MHQLDAAALTPHANEMLDVIVGERVNRTAADALRREIQALDLAEGTLYLGYPVLSTADEPEAVDALLTTPQHGVIIFDLVSLAPNNATDPAAWASIVERQARLYASLKSKLTKHPQLLRRRELAPPIEVLTYGPNLGADPGLEDLKLVDQGQVGKSLCKLVSDWNPAKYFPAVNAAIQRVMTIRPLKRRAEVVRPDSRGGVLKQIEAEIANLDRFQKQSAIECPEGPQRIRGLAGSGKTVVLALKAAYLHAQHPDWTIVVTFMSRALYAMFTDMIRRFHFDQTGDEPEWAKLRILHAWGSPKSSGVYSEIAAHGGVRPLSFDEARTKYGRERAFPGACEEALSGIDVGTFTPLYDAVLIDEAQDLSPAFFRLVDLAVREPKRITFAYDELQRLDEEGSMPAPTELFGRPVELHNDKGEPAQNVVLRTVYRNTPWALAAAHALGFGVYRQSGLVQVFDDASLWATLGYRIVDGELKAGSSVTLERDPEATPAFLGQLVQAQDAVIWKDFPDDDAQAVWIAEFAV